jgi:peptidoglycan hydrolase-like protein with peptidoglycan-binding domain
VTINIDRNWLDLGRGSVAAAEVHCGGIAVDFPAYRRLEKGNADGSLVSALKCLLSEQGAYSGKLGPKYGSRIRSAVAAWRAAHELAGSADDTVWTRPMWRMVLSAGTRPVLKTGSAGPDVRRLQRSLNAAGVGPVAVTGVFTAPTTAAVKKWQVRQDHAATGVFYGRLWKRLQSGGW